MKIDLIILTYKPDKNYVKLLERINEQDTPVNKIYVANIEQKYYDRLRYNEKSLIDYKNVVVRHLSMREADRGKTKNQMFAASDADYVLVMEQDALPHCSDMITKLLNPLRSDDKVAVSYARHIVGEDVPEYIRYIKNYYYPEASYTRSAMDVESYGRMAYFMSNVCALYRRDYFDEIGGFDNHVIINEDILFAYRAINKGYKVAYAADALVDYELSAGDYDYEKKFFDYGVITVIYPEVFTYSEILETGKKIIKLAKNHIGRNCHGAEKLAFSRFATKSMAAFKKGRKFRLIPKDRVLKMTANVGYWNTDEILKARGDLNARLGYGRSEEETNMLKTPPVNAHKWE